MAPKTDRARLRFTDPVCGISVSILCGIFKEYSRFHVFKPVVIVWLGLALATNIVISGTLIM
jgi:hypothetical protein